MKLNLIKTHIGIETDSLLLRGEIARKSVKKCDECFAVPHNS